MAELVWSTWHSAARSLTDQCRTLCFCAVQCLRQFRLTAPSHRRAAIAMLSGFCHHWHCHHRGTTAVALALPRCHIALPRRVMAASAAATPCCPVTIPSHLGSRRRRVRPGSTAPHRARHRPPRRPSRTVTSRHVTGVSGHVRQSLLCPTALLSSLRLLSSRHAHGHASLRLSPRAREDTTTW